MDDVVTKWFLLVCAVVMATVLIASGVSSARSNMETHSEVQKKSEAQNQALLESEFTKFDATEITGSQVINVIKQYEQTDSEKICIEVDNKKSVNDYVYTADLSAKSDRKAVDAKDKGDLTNYINPSSMFLGEVIRDEDTGTIIMVKFTKQ